MLKAGHMVHISHHPIKRNKIQARYKPHADRITQQLSPQTYQIMRRDVTRVVNRANERQPIDHPIPSIPRRSGRTNKCVPSNRYALI